MPSLCFCTKKLSRASYCFYLLIIDMFWGFSCGLTFLLALTCLLTYLRERNFNNGIFKCYAIFRIIIGILALIIYIIVFLVFIKVIPMETNDKEAKKFFSP